MTRYIPAAVCVAGLVLGIPAKAAVIYDFTAMSTTGSIAGNGGTATAPLHLILSISETAVASGSYIASRSCTLFYAGFPCVNIVGSFTGTTLSANGATIISVTPDAYLDNTIISLTFNALGDILSGTITLLTSQWGFPNASSGSGIVIADDTWSTQFNADSSPYQRDCANGNCTASGTITHTALDVAEAPSFSTFGAGLLGFAGLSAIGWRGWRRQEAVDRAKP